MCIRDSWKVGQSSHLVQHILGDMENSIVDTDAGMISTGRENEVAPEYSNDPGPDPLEVDQDYKEKASFGSFSAEINDLFAGDTERADAYIEAMTGKEPTQDGWGSTNNQEIQEIQEVEPKEEKPKGKWGQAHE